MMNENGFKHMIAWAVQSIVDINQRGAAVLDDEKLSEEEKIKAVKGVDGYDYQLLKLLLLIQPVRHDAEKQYPELTQFFTWVDDRLKHAHENKLLEGTCQCKGCVSNNETIEKEKK